MNLVVTKRGGKNMFSKFTFPANLCDFTEHIKKQVNTVYDSPERQDNWIPFEQRFAQRRKATHSLCLIAF